VTDAPLVVHTEFDLFPFGEVARSVITTAGFRYRGIPVGEEHLVATAAQHADALMVSGFAVSAAFIDGLARCKVIARCGAGIDSVDVEHARARGITVTYVPDFCTDEVAEHALALILACERRIVSCDRAVRAGGWPRYGELRPMRRLRGVTLGIVGFGRIGQRLAGLVRAHGLRVVVHDPLLSAADVRGHHVELLPLDEFLPQAEILSLNLPLTPTTVRWLDAVKIAKLPPGVTIVNTARGGVVDEQALLSALETGAVRAAGLDVFATERERRTRLVAHPNVISTPHSAAFSEEALTELFRSAAEDVVRVLSDEAARHPVPMLPSVA
jgi:D-3-phosphoglycerate dehydrogenase / 2-oxoglutarate reductase